jgi:uncharacterized membrane protein YidH (DUF202 family)
MTSSRLVVASACHSIGAVIILVTFATIICQMKKLCVHSSVDRKKEQLHRIKIISYVTTFALC